MTTSGRTAVTLAKPAAPLPPAGTSAADAIYRTLFDSFGPDSGGRISPLEVLARLERRGLRPHDPRIAEALAGLAGEGGGSRQISFAPFKALARRGSSLIRRAVEGNLAVPDFAAFTAGIERMSLVTGRGRTAKRDPRRKKNQTRTEAVVALTWAASQGDLNEVRALIASGVKPGTADYDGRTPMHLAAAEGHTEIVRYLLAAGADPQPTDRWGGTPVTDAETGCHTQIAKLLTQAADKKETAV